jgi:hypothetical protein
MRKIYTVLPIVISFFILGSCAKKMDATYIPSYVKIDNIVVNTTGSQGSSSSYITDAWVYLDGSDRGAYPLPARVPLLAEGKHTIKITPGIKLNGVAGTRVPYPMVEPVEVDVNLIKDSIVPLTIRSRYYTSSKFALIESFEDINLRFETTINNFATWRVSDIDTDPDDFVFEGLHSGLALLDTSHYKLQVITKEDFDFLPKNGIPVFVELNFKTNTTIVFTGMSYGDDGVGESTDLLYLSPTDGEWKKIYINLTTYLSYDTDGNFYKFLLTADHNSSYDDSYVLIDNFKLIYREIEE